MLGSKAKRELQKNKGRICIDSIEIGISSPQQISTWGERRLPNGKKVGEIKNSKTVNYKRFTPLRDGLFCERIFGPVKSYVCACGKAQLRADISFCDKCEVEYIDQRARRYRLGHISLVSPVAHMWYLKGRPSYISLFLGKRKNRIVQLAYANAYLVEHNFSSNSNLSFPSSPSNVITPTFKREKHGANKYTKNVKSYLTTRQIGDIWYNLKKREDSNTPQHIFNNRNCYAKNSPYENSFSNMAFSGEKQDRKEIKLNIDSNLQQASSQSFEQNTNTKNIPTSFFSLLTEVLGHMKKNIVCTDRDSIDNVFLHQRDSQNYKKSFYFGKNKEKYFQIRKENYLSLRFFWGHVVSKEAAQDVFFPILHSLLNTSQSSFFSDKKRGFFQAPSTFFQDRLSNQAENRQRKGRQTACLQNAAFAKVHQAAFKSSSKLSPYLLYAKERTTLFAKMYLYWSKVPTICSLTLFPFVSNRLSSNCMRPILDLFEKQISFSLSHYPNTQCLSFYTLNSKDRKDSLIKKVVPSPFYATIKKHGREQKQNKVFSFQRLGKHAKNSSFEPLENFRAANWHRSTSDWYMDPTSQKGLTQKYQFTPNADIAFPSTSNQPFYTADNCNQEDQKLISNQLKRARFIESASSSSRFTGKRNTALLAISQTPQRTLNLYNRVYTMPFLPSLVCKFQLRDELLNFVESSPFIEDKAIWPYCQLERRRPLRDVHKFMSEEMLTQSFNKPWGVQPESEKENSIKKLNAVAQEETEFLRSPHQSTLDFQGILQNNLKTGKLVNDQVHDMSSNLQETRVNVNNFFQQQNRNKNSFNAIQKKRGRSFAFKRFNYNNIEEKNQIKNSFTAAIQKHKVRTSSLSKGSQSVSSAKLFQVSRNKHLQTRLLEHLESLRYVLYQALLDKSLSFQIESLNTNLPASSKKIPVGVYFRKISKMRSNLLKKVDRKILYSSGMKPYLLALKNRLQANSHTHFQIRSTLFKEVPSLIALTSCLKIQSAENSYRALILQKSWLKSFIIDKNIFHREHSTLKSRWGRLSFSENLKKDTLLSKGGLGLFPHSAFVFSLAHSFGQLIYNKKQFDKSFFQKYCESRSKTENTGWDMTQLIFKKDDPYKNKNLQRFFQTHEKRILHVVYNYIFLKGDISTNSAFSYDLHYKALSAIYPQHVSLIHKDNRYSSFLPPSKLETQKSSVQALSFFLILPHFKSLERNQIDSDVFETQKADNVLCAKTSFQTQKGVSPSDSQFLHVYQKVKRVKNFLDRPSLFDFSSLSLKHAKKFSNFLSEPNQKVVKISENLDEKSFEQFSLSKDNKIYNTVFSSNNSNKLAFITGKSKYVPNFVEDVAHKKEARDRTEQKDRAPFAGKKGALSNQNSAFSSLDSQTIREILSYTGGGALQKLLQGFDTHLLKIFLLQDIKTASALYKKRISESDYPLSRIQKRVLTRLGRRIFKNSRRLKLAQLLMRCKRRPEWMMISILPVLPPDLRPILQMSEGVVVASDLNNLYQRVVYRNNRFHKLSFIDFHLVTAIQRLVQDAVDRLIENGKGGSKPFYTPAGRPLKSLSDTLKGKKGRFRLNLLGKRVDFSGRSVIVVSPHLQIHECGLPREIAIELYDYFLLRYFMLKKQAASIVMAKKIIKQKAPIVWDALRNIMYHHPVLLNRAPTLHRLGIQAFQPKLVRGNAIFLHPLVCSGFNADFDGDQMGVHLPLSTQARAEAWDLLWARNNLLSPATGQTVLAPSQDMVLGFYYMTQSFFSIYQNRKKDVPQQFQLKDKEKILQSQKIMQSAAYEKNEKKEITSTQIQNEPHIFVNYMSLLQAFQNKYIQLHTPVWLQWVGYVENDEKSQIPLEIRLDTFGGSTYIYAKYKRRKDENLTQSQLYIRTTAGRVLLYSTLF